MTSSPEETIATLAAKIFLVFDIESYEKRFGSHYVEEHYFLGRTDLIEVKVMISDDQDHSDRPFWVRLNSRESGADLDVDLIENLVRDRLIPSGLQVARIDKFGQVGEERFDY
ncbi:hypothetical protein [Xanthomonas oryzae]|uniref:hypothetical protein n=1 Tax=Xanthomonas oryzae TaxID=347 RepID=UPI00103520FD|nr:hypothetical protein [Xanthomonas oryzae]QBG97583.1 hypothetical protein EYC55_22420 [Xanthomonas oryzae]QBH01559.1 hypothetical protein EYC56_22870 [Xanthomonas oryzae]